MASLSFSSPPTRPAVVAPPLMPSMQGPAPMPAPMPAPISAPMRSGLPPFAPTPHRDEASFNARLFAVLNSLEQRNEQRPEAPVPAYVKWGLPFLVATQVATLGLLAFNMNEMSALKSCQHSMENTVNRIVEDLEKKTSYQDILVVAQELISNATMTNPALQPLSDAFQQIVKNSNSKSLIEVATKIVQTANKLQKGPWSGFRVCLKAFCAGGLLR